MRSLHALRKCAARHLARYTDPNGPRAFGAYDRVGDPRALTPVDCLAPALLSVRINYKQVIPLFSEQGPGLAVRHALQAVLDATDVDSPHFTGVDDFSSPEGAWAYVDNAIIASGEADGVGVRGLKAVAVTKILHRKRPNLVPIFDREVYRFYFDKNPPTGAYKKAPRRLWPLLHADLHANCAWLADLGSEIRTPDDRPVSLLRLADIVVWEHQVTRCSAS